MFEKNRGIIAAQSAAQQPHGILCIRRHGHAPSKAMQPLYLVRLAVPGIAAFEKAAGDANHHRRREPIHGAPTHGAAVIQLLGGGVRVFAKLNLGYRQKSGSRHADGAANDAFLGETGIEHSIRAEFVLQSKGRRVHPAFAADIFAEDQHPRIDGELVIERAAHRGHQVDPRSVAVSLRSPAAARSPRRAMPPCCCKSMEPSAKVSEST